MVTPFLHRGLPETRARTATGALFDIRIVGVLILSGITLFIASRYFPLQDDEVRIIFKAWQSPREILDAFLNGLGQHMHPPLSDLLIHYWLLTGTGMAWVRLLNIGIYVAGLALLARTAERIAGRAAAVVLLLCALLWPSPVHAAWMVGWYSVSFFLLAALTLTYLRFVQDPSLTRWALRFLSASVFLWTNYYAWALILCLTADWFLRSRRMWGVSSGRVALTLALLVLVFLPLLPAFVGTYLDRWNAGQSPIKMIPYGAWTVFALFVGESVGPWHFWLSVPAAVAIVTVTVVILRVPGPSRRLLVASLLLVAVLALLGVASTQRLMGVAAWPLLAVAVSWTKLTGRARRILAASMVVVALIGWFGTFSRRYYPRLGMLEPWQQVSSEVASDIRRGAAVLAYHPILFFYLHSELQTGGATTAGPLTSEFPERVRHPSVFDPVQWMITGRPLRHTNGLLRASGDDLGAQNGDACQDLAGATLPDRTD